MRGDGDDSDAEGDGYDIAQSCVDGMVEVERERYNADGFQIECEVECDDQPAVEGEDAMVISDDNSATVWGAPANWHPPQVAPTWKPKPVQVDKGEPPFHEVDNPGGWSEYTYKAVMNKIQESIAIMLCHPALQPYPLTPSQINAKLVDMNLFI
jgi:hypothetical protein